MSQCPRISTDKFFHSPFSVSENFLARFPLLTFDFYSKFTRFASDSAIVSGIVSRLGLGRSGGVDK